jgi:hypothetical protein
MRERSGIFFRKDDNMTYSGSQVTFSRGQRIDLYITTLRNEAEDVFGTAFDEAGALGRKIEDPRFSNEQFDAAVIGLICSVVLRTRPVPKFLRKALGVLLEVAPEERGDLITVPVVGGQSSLQARTDRATIDFVIDHLKEELYSTRTFAGPFTDLGCGLDGLKLTWRRDILSEADANGIISIEGLKRIRSKLAAVAQVFSTSIGPIAFDKNGKPARVADQATDRNSERRLKLVEIVEHAISIGSTITCSPSGVREERISQAYERPAAPSGRTA